MRHLLSSLFSSLIPSFIPPDAGAGTGGSGLASGSGAGAGAGAGGSGQSAGAGAGSGDAAARAGSGAGQGHGQSQGGAQPFRLADDALVDLGDGRTGRWSELRDTLFMPRDRYNQGVQFLNDIAANLDQREQALLARATNAQQGRGPDGRPLQDADPFADLEGMPIVDGKTLATLARRMNSEGFGKMAQAIAALSTKLTALERGQTTLGDQASRTQARDQETEFSTYVDKALTAVTPTIQNLPNGVPLDPKDPFVRELARDIYSSFESWKSDAEFHKVLGERLSSAIAMVRALDKRALEAGQDRRRKFLNPAKGNARPNGESQYVHHTGTSLAKMLFHGTDATT